MAKKNIFNKNYELLNKIAPNVVNGRYDVQSADIPIKDPNEFDTFTLEAKRLPHNKIKLMFCYDYEQIRDYTIVHVNNETKEVKPFSLNNTGYENIDNLDTNFSKHVTDYMNNQQHNETLYNELLFYKKSKFVTDYAEFSKESGIEGLAVFNKRGKEISAKPRPGHIQTHEEYWEEQLKNNEERYQTKMQKRYIPNLKAYCKEKEAEDEVENSNIYTENKHETPQERYGNQFELNRQPIDETEIDDEWDLET